VFPKQGAVPNLIIDHHKPKCINRGRRKGEAFEDYLQKNARAKKKVAEEE